ncbi:S-adenosyl-L-methionine-dependent methyltransferase [Myriangium duriaei CBS 260.36]|uniref:catechol O-methyltransferase n=1 Tax=Myriangium duriaei CBS 260.36 TaxID=1168546 RepID=A0A9P4J929_9PEZI|nr:S-adenosyl-L-methionine-dependent methyltransferase [Myriangium duriaei CBS 260.36]
MSTETDLSHIPGFKRTMETEVESHDGREGRVLTFIKSRIDGEPTPIPVKTLLDLMDEFSFQEDFLISIGDHKAKVFTDIIHEKKPKTFVEFGGYLGYSALLVAAAIKEYASDGHIWSVEADKDCAAIASELITLAGLDHMITVVLDKTTDAIPKLQGQGHFKNVDMLFLDHDESLYKPDFQTCLATGVIGTGTTIVADNVVRPGAPEYRRYVRELKGVQSKGVRGLITPGNFEDEFEVTEIVNADEARQ